MDHRDILQALMQAETRDAMRHILESMAHGEHLLERSAGPNDGQQPPFECDFESELGKDRWKFAESLKENGNKALKDKHYEAAIKLYSEALQVAYKIRNNGDQLAKILSNRSLVYAKMSNFHRALADARGCFFQKQTWFKGPWRFMSALRGLNRFEVAYNLGLHLLVFYQVPFNDQLSIFKEVLLLLPIITDYTEIHKLNIGIDVWKSVLAQLTKDNEWQTISILFKGKNNYPAPIKPSESKEAAEDLDLSGLLESCSVAEWKSWGQRLAAKLLQAGAKMVSLDPDKKHGAHSAFRVGMKTGVYDLLRHLFLRHIPIGDRDRVDDEGNTLLHVACCGTYETKLTAVKLLLEHDMGPLCRNNRQQKPADLLPKDDLQRTEILKSMENKGYRLSNLQSTPGEVEKLSSSDETNCQPTASSARIPPVTSRTELLTQTWTQQQVRAWMNDNGIRQVLTSLEDLDGRQLAELRRMLETAPTTFYHLLHSTIGMSLAQLFSVASAVRKLP